MYLPSSLTLAAAKNSPLVNIAGVCPSSSQFVGLVNEATERLMTYGNFWGTIIKGKICTYNNCVAWPRWVGTILAANVNNRPRQIANHWYEFMPLSPADCHWDHKWSSNAVIIDDGTVPVFRNIPCASALLLQIHTRFQADKGKEMTFYGLDENGQEVMTKDALGNWVLGETIALDIPDVTTTKYFREITRVTREATTGPVDVYAVNTDGLLLEVASFEPSETEPRYRHSRVNLCRTGSCCCSTSGTYAPQIDFLAKLQFIPVVADTDLIQIGNLTGLKLMMQAVRMEEAGDDEGAMRKQAMAIKELNRELSDKLPVKQVPISIEPFGNAYPALAGVGRMI